MATGCQPDVPSLAFALPTPPHSPQKSLGPLLGSFPPLLKNRDGQKWDICALLRGRGKCWQNDWTVRGLVLEKKSCYGENVSSGTKLIVPSSGEDESIPYRIATIFEAFLAKSLIRPERKRLRCASLSSDPTVICKHKNQQLKLSPCHLLTVHPKCPFLSTVISPSGQTLRGWYT